MQLLKNGLLMGRCYEKLLYCPVCDDVIRLIDNEWRMCQCHRSGGQYTPDSETAVIGGKGKVFGIPNPFFYETYMAPPKDIVALRAKYNDLWITEVWWGEYKGDPQLIRVHNPLGPIPTDWEKRLQKFQKNGGAKGYEGRTEIENSLRDKWRTNALLKSKFQDLCRRLFVRWRSKDQVIVDLQDELEQYRQVLRQGTLTINQLRQITHEKGIVIKTEVVDETNETKS